MGYVVAGVMNNLCIDAGVRTALPECFKHSVYLSIYLKINKYSKSIQLTSIAQLHSLNQHG